MTTAEKSIDIPNDFKNQADELFKNLHSMIDDVLGRISSIEKSMASLQAKISGNTEGSDKKE